MAYIDKITAFLAYAKDIAMELYDEAFLIQKEIENKDRGGGMGKNETNNTKSSEGQCRIDAETSGKGVANQ